ncbi:MAG TPA: cytochrome c-type biogenesis protein [Alphaproteobacteria bacterium]|nr:cytochrome c-type biogenesis protein [Alphaproteobacteria bacterium]
MMRLLAFQLVVLLALLASPVLAVQPGEMLADPKLEARARSISEELRCLVCQNQSIDESDADLAHDLRVLLRERLLAGDSDAQAIKYIVDRYGQFVLLKPPVEPATYALWLSPLLLVLFGAAGIAVYLRRRRAQLEPAALSAAEEAELKRLIEEGGP